MQGRWYFRICAWAVVLAGAGASAWSGTGEENGSESPRAAKPIRVEKCVVKLLREAVLSFERPGILGVVSVTEGDLAREGQLLVKLKDDVAKASLAVAEEEAASDVDIRFSQAASEVALAEYDKNQEANRRVQGTVPEIEVKKTKLAYDKTVLEIEKAQHTREVHRRKRDEAAAQLETFRMEAPWDGVVTRVHLSEGASIKQGDPIVELVRTSKVKVEGHVSLADATRVRPGAKVSVQIDSPHADPDTAKKTYPGKIVFVDVKATPVDHKVRVWAEVENLDNSLRRDLTTVMTIHPAR